MLDHPTRPRILFVTPDAAFRPEGADQWIFTVDVNEKSIDNFPAELISELFDLGADVCVAQPDFRNIFKTRSCQENAGKDCKLPRDRLYLAEDRAIFYSKPINSNSEWENIKISLAFQREVINQIIPRVQPDLIHCYNWMTGIIPAAARFFEIPCLFTAQKFVTARSILSYVEDCGIDAAVFWQHLFYDRYPIDYEETRETNPADFLLSGIFAADFVTTSSMAFMADGCRDQSCLVNFPIWQVIVKKMENGLAAVDQHRAKAGQYIDIYEKLLQHEILQPMSDDINVPNCRII